VPDGSTILIHSNLFVIEPQLKNANYDPLTSFAPICKLVNSPSAIVVNAASPYRTLGELVAAARAKPGELTLATVGPGSAVHLAFEQLKRSGGIDMTYVPYGGGMAPINAVVGGHVTASFAIYAQLGELIAAGKLRALAVSSHARIAALPDVPTLSEAGYKDVEADVWQGVFAPATAPNETLLRIGGWFMAALQTPELAPKLAAQELYPAGLCGAEFGAFLRKQYDDYGRAIRDGNIKVQ
jgi:tripartite-type tricarboxylate transporter receptor subunit TctC